MASCNGLQRGDASRRAQGLQWVTAWLPLATVLVTATALLPARSAHAAEVTDVLDSFDEGKPFGGSLRLRFETDGRDATVAREVKCLAGDAAGQGVCPTSGIYLAKELKYKRRKNTLNLDARFGLYKDFEFYAYFPIVLSDQWQHSFQDGVTRANSTIFPTFDKEVLFEVPYNSGGGKARSGFGDMTLGIKWSPFNYYRDATDPTWVMGIESILPTGKVMAASNTAVGQGVYQIRLFTTISRRALQYFEPFFGAHAAYKAAASGSLFDVPDPNETQSYKNPGWFAGTQFGLTILPWEDVGLDRRVEIEFGSALDYVGRGRDYSEIWEALASPSNPCKQEIGCTNTSHQNSDVDPVTSQHRQTNGLTDIEPFGRVSIWSALHYQPVKNFQISARISYLTETPHFITFGEYGKDLNGDNVVQQANSAKPPQNEFSPVYLPSVDTPGQRLRVLDVSNVLFMVSISGKL
jgi:hypothetical protein